MTNDQFDLLARLMRLRDGSAREVVRLVLVEGLDVQTAAAQEGISYKTGHAAVQRAKEWLAAVHKLVD